MDSRKRPKAKEVQNESIVEEETSHVPLFTDKRRGKGKQVVRTNKNHGISREQLTEFERQKMAEAQEWYNEVKTVEAQMRAGSEEAISHWLLYAERLVEMFREARQMFTARQVSGLWLSRHADID